MPTILGIVGVSCSGKSYLASALHHTIPLSTLIQQDSFYHQCETTSLLYWESIESIDHVELTNCIIESSNKYSVVIVEGFLLHHPLLAPLFTHFVILDIPFEVGNSRRSNRVLADGDFSDPVGHYQFVWDTFHSCKFNLFEVNNNRNYLLLSGTDPVDSLVNKVLDLINN
ncbi:hypothetical protein P9112_005229 [Eukaryota sp. TZLM1-RC]